MRAQPLMSESAYMSTDKCEYRDFNDVFEETVSLFHYLSIGEHGRVYFTL